MGRRVVDTTIDRTADEVWEAIRDFGELDWYPHVATCVVADDVRTVTRQGRDLEIDELLTAYDEDGRSFSYLLTELRGDTTVQRDGESHDIAHLGGHVRAGMVVEALDATSSKVTYWLEVDEGHDQHIDGNARNYKAAIDQLKARLDG
jgi:hypothetical protein